MSKPPEVVGMMDGGTMTKEGRGWLRVRRVWVWVVGACVVGGLVGAAFLGYRLAPCQGPRATRQAPGPPGSRHPRDVRLPTSVLPDSYLVRLLPFAWAGNFTFSGTVDILLNVTRATDNITLHASDLDLRRTALFRLPPGRPQVPVPISDTKTDDEREFFLVFPDQTLYPGRYRLTIEFVGELNNALQGFYRSSYTVNNSTRWIATTQFQSTDARRAFPCFDEPALKAKFTLNIGRPVNMTTISNMPKVGQPQPVEGLTNHEWDQFDQSVPMSTYLVAFTVCDFSYLTDGTFTVWARKEAIEQANFALEIGPKILHYFEDYFQIPFPLPKIDMIAIPDFAAGAMENWGLITYRENAMLYKKGVSTNKHKQRVGTVVAHELAHQWFGNLVTPAWWSDLWLNEGFATYIECIGVDVVEPSWRTVDQFVVQDLQNVLQLDAYKSSHPVSSEVSHPNEIDEIFDSISYGKGASIIRMMDHFLTTSVFKRGLTNYLRSRAYQSATQDDLWAALTKQAHDDNALDKDFNVKEIMDTWTLKTGFPLVTITRNYKEGSVTISQKRFQYGNMTTIDGSDWWVPLSYTTQTRLDFNKTQPSFWLKAKESITTPLEAEQNEWVVFNIKETGFYRVNYDKQNWEMLTAYLMDPKKFHNIGELNRAQIIDDSLELARAGVESYALALNLTKYLAHELDYIPWAAALPAFSYIDTMINKMPVYDKFKKFMLNLLNLLYTETGFADDPLTDPQLTVYKRVDALKWACYLGQEHCLRNAVTYFQKWRSYPYPDKNIPISPNLKATVYCSALREGGQAEWDFAWKRYLNANVGSEKALLLGALGCTRETWILSRYLHWSVTEGSGIRKQDAAAVFAAVSNNVIGQPLAFAFLRDNWQRIKQYFGTTVFTINNIIRVTTSEMNTEFELKMLKDFAEAHSEELDSATKVVEQAIEHAESNVLWMKENYHQIEEWLKDLYKNS